MQIRYVTHIGGSPSSAGCSTIGLHDAYTADEYSVTCDDCIRMMKAENKKGKLKVKYNPARSSWGVWNEFEGRFVAHATTRLGATIRRQRIRNSSLGGWNS